MPSGSEGQRKTSRPSVLRRPLARKQKIGEGKDEVRGPAEVRAPKNVIRFFEAGAAEGEGK